MKQTGVRPDRIIPFGRVNLVKTHRPDRALEPVFGLGGDFGYAVGGVDVEACRNHRFAVPSTTASEFEDRCAVIQSSKKRIQMRAATTCAAGNVSWRFFRVEFQSGGIEGKFARHGQPVRPTGSAAAPPR